MPYSATRPKLGYILGAHVGKPAFKGWRWKHEHHWPPTLWSTKMCYKCQNEICLLANFLPKVVTINAACYVRTLKNNTTSI